VDDIETVLMERAAKEINSTEIGEMVIRRLQDLDDVAYVRFASVYRQFKDITAFMDEVKRLMSRKS
jgi:transcriptional repressor NrdR